MHDQLLLVVSLLDWDHCWAGTQPHCLVVHAAMTCWALRHAGAGMMRGAEWARCSLRHVSAGVGLREGACCALRRGGAGMMQGASDGPKDGMASSRSPCCWPHAACSPRGWTHQPCDRQCNMAPPGHSEGKAWLSSSPGCWVKSCVHLCGDVVNMCAKAAVCTLPPWLWPKWCGTSYKRISAACSASHVLASAAALHLLHL